MIPASAVDSLTKMAEEDTASTPTTNAIYGYNVVLK